MKIYKQIINHTRQIPAPQNKIEKYYLSTTFNGIAISDLCSLPFYSFINLSAYCFSNEQIFKLWQEYQEENGNDDVEDMLTFLFEHKDNDKIQDINQKLYDHFQDKDNSYMDLKDFYFSGEIKNQPVCNLMPFDFFLFLAMSAKHLVFGKVTSEYYRSKRYNLSPKEYISQFIEPISGA